MAKYLTTPAKVACSFWNIVSIASPVIPPGTMPRPVRRLTMSGFLTNAAISVLIASMIGCRRSGRREKAVPGDGIEARHGLGNRREIGHGGEPLRRADGDQADLGVVGERQQGGGIAEIKIGGAAHQIGNRLRLGARRHHDKVDAGLLEQPHRREVAEVLCSGGGEIQLARIGFGVGQKFRQIFRRQAAFDRDHLRAGSDIGDRHQLLHRVEFEIFHLWRQRDHR